MVILAKRFYFLLIVVVAVLLVYFVSRGSAGVCVLPETNEFHAIDFERELLLLFSKDLGYALIGSKPVSVDFLSEFASKDVKTKEAIFSYLENTFSKSSNFILRIFKGSNCIEIVNIKALSQQIRKSKKLRAFVYTTYKSESNFFHMLRKSDLDISAVLHFDSVLKGIAFGYGEENAMFFVRRADIAEYLQKYPIVSFFPFDQRPGPFWAISHNDMYFKYPDRVYRPRILPKFRSLEQEWEDIKKSERKLFENEQCPLYYIGLPSYISRHGPESDIIHAGFLRARNSLAKMFYSKKPSEAIAQEVAKK